MVRKIIHIGESQFVRRVRRTNGLTIYFKNKDEVYVTDGKTTSFFERWADGRFVYEDRWKPFCHELVRKNTLTTLWDVYRLANKYDVIGHTSGRSFPEIPDDAKVLPDYYSRRPRRKQQ